MLYKFRKIDKLLNIIPENIEDLELMLKLCEDNNDIWKDEDYIMDYINLLEYSKYNGINIYIKNIELIIELCLSNNNDKNIKYIINRLYNRGFIKELTYSIINIYKKDKNFNGTLGFYESTLKLCCNLLRLLSNFIEIIEYKLYIKDILYIKLINLCINLLLSSYININHWNINALYNLYHPLSRCILPDVILLILIDYLPINIQFKLLEKLLLLWSDKQLILKFINNNDIILSSCIIRLLYKLNTINDNLIPYILKGINFRLGLFDNHHRLSAMAIAEIFNNISNHELNLKFDELHNCNIPLLYLCKNDTLIPNNLYNNKHPPEVHPAVSSSNYFPVNGSGTPRDRGEGCDGSSIMGMMEDSAKDVLNVTSSGMKISTRPQVEPAADLREAEGQLNREAPCNGNDGPRVESCLQDKERTSGGDVILMDKIFDNVPKIIGDDISDYIKEYWMEPPKYILQCYERLNGNPIRGDVDIESLLIYNLDKIDDIDINMKIKYISQTLVYLPHIIIKNELILKKLCIPLCILLIKLDDLYLYKDEIINLQINLNKKINTINEIYPINSLIFKSILLLNYNYPLNLFKYFIEQLTNSEYTLTQKSIMILSVQYTIIKLNTNLTIDSLVNLYHKSIPSTTFPENPLEVQSSSFPPEVITTVPLAVDASPNYLSLKGNVTPRDRGEDGCVDGMKSSTRPQVEPAADLREAKGELNRRGTTPSGKTTSDGIDVIDIIDGQFNNVVGLMDNRFTVYVEYVLELLLSSLRRLLCIEGSDCIMIGVIETLLLVLNYNHEMINDLIINEFNSVIQELNKTNNNTLYKYTQILSISINRFNLLTL